MVEPRHFILPEGIVTSGYPVIRKIATTIGVRYMEWQDKLNRAQFAKNAAGLYAADVVVISICRQCGKTYNVGTTCFCDSIFLPNTTTVWTAHRFKVARESFMEMRALAKSSPLSSHINAKDITTAAGNECIPFLNGSRIVFAARERGAIRGFAGVHRLVLDEAQILSESVMSDLAPILNQGFNPQLVLMGTPPKPGGHGEVLAEQRAQAVGGRTTNMLYMEYSADADCDPDDWAAVAAANPSYPEMTPKRSIIRLRGLLTEDDYMREGLGVWALAGRKSVIPEVPWDQAGDSESVAVGRMVLGLEVGPDLSWASVALGGQRSDGDWHMELDERRDGATWLIPYVEGVLAANPNLPAPVVDVSGPISALLTKKGRRWYLKDTRIRVRPVTVAELGQGCARMLSGIMTGTIHHIRQPQMTTAARMAGKRKLGDTGLWVFARSSSDSDITPILAAVLALVGAQSETKQRKQSVTRAPSGNERRAVVLSG